MNIISKKEHVHRLLKTHPHLRDDDNKLIATVWWKEMGEEKSNQKIFNFLKDFANGFYSNPESIRRIRQKIQEEFADCRGEKWELRRSNQKNVKDQLYNTPEILKGGTP